MADELVLNELPNLNKVFILYKVFIICKVAVITISTSQIYGVYVFRHSDVDPEISKREGWLII